MSNSVSQSRSGEAGFTLIELLVSLAILSVALGLLGAGLRIFSRNWEASAKRIEMLDMVSRAYDILARDAAGLQRLVATGDRGPRYLFSGTRDALAFVTLEPPYPSESGPYFVSYAAASEGRRTELIRARAPYRQGMQAFPGATPANRVPLLEGSLLYQFSYALSSDGPEGWRPSWPYTNRLPDLIRLEVIDISRQQPLSPPLVVAIRTDAELNCLESKPEFCSATEGGALKAESDSHKDETNPGQKPRHD